ncbi:MAG: hypothetical protein AB1847_18625 [bacterium]
MIRKKKLMTGKVICIGIFCLLCIWGIPEKGYAGPGDAAHSAHLTLDRGPQLENDCSSCHTATPPDAGNVNYALCIPCHSPDGAYDGMDDPSIGARNNWGAGAFSAIYEADGSLKEGKGKWCVGCHDDGSCVIRNVAAPNIAGRSISGDWQGSITLVSSDIPGAENLLDGDTGTGNTGSGSYLIVDFSETISLSHLRLYTSLASTSHWEVYGGDDLIGWTRIVFGQSVLFSAPTWQTGPLDGWNETRLDRFIPVRYLKLVKISPWPFLANALGELEIKKDMQYGYYVTGHKINCHSCHDTAGVHTDETPQTYQADLDNYQAGYRLRSVEVEGQLFPPLEIPRTGCNSGEYPRTSNDFALCFACHDKYKLLGDAYGTGDFFQYPLQTNFRNDDHLDANQKVSNEHLRHLRGRYYCGNGQDWDSDWDGIADSPQSCTTCHNVHGSPAPVMTRRGELAGPTGTAAPHLNLHYLDAEGNPDPDLSLVMESTGGRTQFYGPGPGVVEKNFTCKMCHNDQMIYHRDPIPSPVADCQSCHAEGVESSGSHSTHLGADLKGPSLDCGDCHAAGGGINPHGVESVFADGKSLEETEVCDNCHSPAGAYDGVSDPVIGAKGNWEQGVYQESELQAGKERWCATCHDNAPANSQIDGSGIFAPVIAGDDSNYGFYVNGHKSSLCSACHDVTIKHVDGNCRTYAFSTAYYGPSQSGVAYASGYRLRYVNGQVPLMIPANYSITFSYNSQTMKDNAFRLCFSCHDDAKIFDNTPGDGLDTNFKASLPSPPRNYSYAWGSGADTNEHVSHVLNYTGPFADSDWDTATNGPGGSNGRDTMMACSNCHNVHGAAVTHGSTNEPMIRDGGLAGRTGYGFSYVVEDVANGGYPMVTSTGATQANSVGAVFRNNTANMCGGSMCHGNPNPPPGSSYNASGSSWGTYLEYYRPPLPQ